MTRSSWKKLLAAALLAAWLTHPAQSQGVAAKPAAGQQDTIPAQRFMQPGDLVPLLATGQRPMILHVGPHVLYTKGHIPGAESIQEAGTPEGAQALRRRVAGLKKDQPIVLYCGCCPWDHCPNVHPAYQVLAGLGFTRIQVLYLPGNFATDWIRKGFPVVKGG